MEKGGLKKGEETWVYERKKDRIVDIKGGKAIRKQARKDG